MAIGERATGVALNPRAALEEIAQQVVACRRCPRLAAYIQEVAQQKRRAFRHWDYWGRPVPGFGDPQARLLIVGLAPAAHGANRTGRMFTGDRSGDWLYQALFATGFANQPTSRHRDDGLRLQDAYVTAVCRCAPPGNKPSRQEMEACRVFLEREWQVLERVRVVVALGQVAFDTVLRLMKRRGWDWPVEISPDGKAVGNIQAGGSVDGRLDGSPDERGRKAPATGSATAPDPRSADRQRPRHGRKPRFRHGGMYRWLVGQEDSGLSAGHDDGPRPAVPPVLLASYHPSQQNTQTGLLTEPMFLEIFRRARRLIGGDAGDGLPTPSRNGPGALAEPARPAG